MIPVINCINGIDTTIFWAFVQSTTVVLYYYICGGAAQFLVENTVTFKLERSEKGIISTIIDN